MRFRAINGAEKLFAVYFAVVVRVTSIMKPQSICDWKRHMNRVPALALILGILISPVFLSAKVTTRAPRHSRAARVQESARAGKRIRNMQHPRPMSRAHLRRASLVRRSVHGRHHRVYERFTGNSFVDADVLNGDITSGEDQVVRQAAIDALGNMNGTVVAIDPNNGRVLAMVNQKLALSEGAEPCSTIKLSVALAALEERVVTKDTPVNLGGRYSLNMTEALAHSNNAYFETLGRRLGFERVKHYANEFGLGEYAGYNIKGEHLGVYPTEALPDAQGGVGRMCSFGEGVSVTPLQLGALLASIANGGTLFYLQHPETADEIMNFKPMVKRMLDIGPLIPEISPGMGAAVQYGTARSVRSSFSEFPVLGKTGTCSNNGTRFGWFASFADTPSGRIVVVFFLKGGRPTFGPKAAELAGHFYRNLSDKSYFTTARNAQPILDKQPTVSTGVSQ
jgi:membrane carboxypeptidase/penicillin-binding protein